MKNKLIVVLSILLVVVSFTGCSSNKSSSNNGGSSKKYETKSNDTKIFEGDELIKVAYNDYGDSVWLPSNYHCWGSYYKKDGTFVDLGYNTDLSKTKTVKEVAEEMPKGAYICDMFIANSERKQEGGWAPVEVNDDEDMYRIVTCRFVTYQELYESDHNVANKKKGSKIGYIRSSYTGGADEAKWQCMLGGDILLKDWPEDDYRFAVKFDYFGKRFATDAENFEDICSEMMSILEFAK